ncbi:MAG: beta-phosphoglucomutase, partial [Bacteroidota bacterium]
AWKQLAESIGASFSESQNEQLKGVSRVRSLEKILEWSGISLSESEFESLMEQKNNEYLQYISKMDRDEILPDVERLIAYVKGQGSLIALGSASKNARTILQKVQLFDHFNAIVDGTNVTKAKPDPEVFLLAASQLDRSPEDCVVFEDAVAGVQAANAAGMVSIGIGSQEVLHEADYVFADFTEISNEFLSNL